MRVLDTETGHFKEIDPKDRTIEYAILSHTWRRKGEQTYQQIRDIQREYTPSSNGNSYDDYSSSDDDSPPNSTAKQRLRPIWDHPKLSSKIKEACRVARERGYRYLWIDSCCIDKTSSSELSESINSMYQWYALADICYAFLADVRAEEDQKADDSGFRRSRWFARGWTLQELIAPPEVTFFAKDWKGIGSRQSLVELVVEITHIDFRALLHVEPLEKFSIAQRFSWASRRETTRLEDRAYSLLGIFDINMPTLYGEGERAFRRLQEEIMRRTPDQSLFAWTESRLQFSLSDMLQEGPDFKPVEAPKSAASPSESFLAPSLDVFRECEGIRALSHDEVCRRLGRSSSELPVIHYDFTPYGICVQLPLLQFNASQGFTNWVRWLELMSQVFGKPIRWENRYLIILGCEHRDFPGHLLARVCYQQNRYGTGNVEFWFPGYIYPPGSGTRCGLLPITPENIARLCTTLSRTCTRWLYIPQPFRIMEETNWPLWRIELALAKNSVQALSAQECTVIALPAIWNTLSIGTQSVTLITHDTHTITIDFRVTLSSYDLYLQRGEQTLEIEAHVKTSKGDQEVSPGAQDNVVSWSDYRPWRRTLETRSVELDTPEGSTLSLGLAFGPRDTYNLSIEIINTAHPSSSLPRDPVPLVDLAPVLDAGGLGPSTPPRTAAIIIPAIGAGTSNPLPP